MRLSFLPREDKFFFMLHQGAMNIQKVAVKFKDLMDNFDDVEAKVTEIKDLEEMGDQVIHDIVHGLHRTFVTPIDREDILALAERLDDVVDAIEEAARHTLEYKISESTRHARLLADTIVQCGDELVRATAIMLDRKGHLRDILPMTVELNRLENEADQIISRAMGDLFSNGQDAIYILKWRDIYNDLEEATDMAEDAANVLEGIVLKHA